MFVHSSSFDRRSLFSFENRTDTRKSVANDPRCLVGRDNNCDRGQRDRQTSPSAVKIRPKTGFGIGPVSLVRSSCRPTFAFGRSPPRPDRPLVRRTPVDDFGAKTILCHSLFAVRSTTTLARASFT